MGEKEAEEMSFWTQEEYERFIEAVKDKPQSFYAFEILYWCGLRMGELLALTKEKLDFNTMLLGFMNLCKELMERMLLHRRKQKRVFAK